MGAPPPNLPTMGARYKIDPKKKRGSFVHHWLSTGRYTVAGVETSGGPPGQLSYAFARGASKQHGPLLFSNPCSFTKWGHKVPGDPHPSANCTVGGDHGETCGTSYSSMKKLMYTQVPM